MPFTVNDDALSKLDALDDAQKRAVLERLSGEERAQVVAALPAWKQKRTEAKPQAKPEVRTSGLEAIASGLGQSALGLGDELGAYYQAERSAVRGLPNVIRGKTSPTQLLADALGTYRQARSENRAIDEQAREQNPLAFYGGQLAGVAGTAPLAPGMALAKGAGAGTRILGSAASGFGQGAAYGAGASEADLTRGEVGKFAADVLRSGGVGALTSGVLGAAGAGLRALRGRAAKGIEDATAAERAAQQRLTEKNIESQRGSYRSAVQSASRDLEVAGREAQGTDDVAMKARAWLESPDAQALRKQVLLNKLETGPERIAEMTGAKTKLAEMVAGKEANIEAQTAEALKNPVQKHIAPRLWTLGHRLLPLTATPVLGTIGGLIGGTEGMIAGGALGTGAATIMSLTQGLPGRILKNLMREPAARKAFWEKVLSSSGATPETATAINALEKAARTSPAAFAAAFHEITGRSLDENPAPQKDPAKALRDALQ